MNVVKVKTGVRFDRIAAGGFRILAVLVGVARDAGLDLEISCGTEDHDAHDPHTSGQAYDVSVAGFDVDHVVDVRGRLIHELGPLFTVLYERPDAANDPRLATFVYINAHATAPHLHIQVKNGVLYPPIVASSSPAAV